MEEAKEKVLILMRGIPASGKSTIANSLGDKVFSTDDYWVKYTPFNPNKLVEAHSWNRVCVLQAMLDEALVIVVDNTNICAWEREPYEKLAEKYGYTVEVVTVNTPLEVCLERNEKREKKVPREVVLRMYEKMREEDRNDY